MPQVELQFHAVCRTVESGVTIASPLLMPELSAIAAETPGLVEQLSRHVGTFLNQLPPLERHRRVMGGPPSVTELRMTLDPPRVDPAWQEPIDLALSYVSWQTAERQQAAFVPALDLTLVGGPDEFEKRLEEEVLAVLKRREMTTSYREVSRLREEQPLQIVSFDVSVELPTPKQHFQKDEDDRKPILPEIANAVSGARQSHQPETFERDDLIAQLADTLAGRRPRSVLLVGPSGVGKTAVFQAVARRAASLPVRDHEFWMSSGSRLMAGALGFGGWQERCQTLCREVSGKRIVLHLGALRELIEVGKCGGSSGVGEFLRPAIERGELLAVVECTLEERALMERENPGLIEAFTEIRLAEPDAEAGRRILEQFARSLHRGGIEPLNAEAIDQLDRLHRRYATASVSPGRPLRFLRNLLDDRPNRDHVITADDVLAAFSRETGLPQFLLDPSLPMDLAQVREWFSARVMGQPEAVQVVVSLLAIVKARLARPHKPLASLLFLGPTGVGKTEMAKTLAEFFFQDRQRMIRIDASEYADPFAVGRLTGAAGQGEGLLTSKVRDQPFSVVLLDEFEKAHPLFFDVLLQVLGEGRLTDAAGRLADFRNCVIVMTSNLGADAVRRGAVGFGDARADADNLREQYLKQVKNFLRPEMFNRIDSVVPFAALDEATLTRIARSELRQVDLRAGLRARSLALEIGDEVVGRLTQLGFDAQYGARPLKRAIEKHLLAPLAAQLNKYSVEENLEASVALDAEEPAEVSVRLRAVPRTAIEKAARQSRSQLAADIAKLRRTVFRADASALVLDLRNEVFRLEREEKAGYSRKGPARPFDSRLAARLGVLRQLDGRMKEVVAEVTALEDNVLTATYKGDVADDPEKSRRAWSGSLRTASSHWDELLFDLYEHQLGDDDGQKVLLAIYSDDADVAVEIAGLYRGIAHRQGHEVDLWTLHSCQGNYQRPLPEGSFRVGEPETAGKNRKSGKVAEGDTDESEPTILEAHPVRDQNLGGEQQRGLVGVLLSIRGRLAAPFFGLEAGLHVQKRAKSNPGRWLIDVAGVPVDRYEPPEGADRREAFAGRERRREYTGWEFFRDNQYGRVELGKDHAAALSDLLIGRLRKEAEEVVES